MNMSKSAFRRYKVIDNLLRNKVRKFPTMEDIIDECREKLDYETTKETIQKDIANMKLPYPDGFDAPIRFNRMHMGYEYTDSDYSISGVSLRYEELEAIQEALELVRAIGGSRVSDKFNHAIEKVLSATLEVDTIKGKKLPVLQTMVPPTCRGFENFDSLYRACNERLPVSFIHFSTALRKFNHVILHPFLIKEFDNRWYVIGFSENHQEVQAFGFDSLTNPILLKKKYTPTDSNEIESYLKDVYGVLPIPGSSKEQIIIRANKFVTHELIAYPIHKSQQVKKEEDGSSFVYYELIPSIELARYYLSLGPGIEILQPEWFRGFTKNLAL